MMEKTYDETTGKINMEYFEGSFKQVTIYINESQERGLRDFFDSIGFHRYALIKNVESSWTSQLKHLNTHAWPGSDCMFILSVREDELPGLLKSLKAYRMTLSENIIFALGILPVEKIIPDLYNYEI